MIVLKNIKKMNKIKELQKRKSLYEGRNFGIGFTILNKVNNGFETHLPFTACRDYLNDFSYVEYTKKEIGTIHGYNHKLLNCFNNKRIFYLGVNTLHFNSGVDWEDKEKAQELLVKNYKNLESLLNNIEEKTGIKGKSVISLDDDTLIIKSPIYWSKTTALISVYTLIIRCFFNISDEESKLDIIEILGKHKCFIDGDNYMIKNCVAFYEKLDNVKFDKINYVKYNISSNSQVHNFGIAGFLSKLK